jgi:hypothetical protein
MIFDSILSALTAAFVFKASVCAKADDDISKSTGNIFFIDLIYADNDQSL